MNRCIRTALATATVLAATAPAARADIIALATTVAPTPRTDLDLARVDVSTGRLLSLPAGVNTTDDEDHASISSSGSRLVFERRTPSSSTARIVVTDVATGSSSDAFNGFEAAQSSPTTPSITPDGKTVLTGGPDPTISGKVTPAVTLTDMATFPAGPYTHTSYTPGFGFSTGTFGGVFNPVATGTAPGSLIAYDYDELSTTLTVRGLIFGAIGSQATALTRTMFQYEHPALGSPGGSPIVAFDERPLPGCCGTGDIVFRPGAPATFAGTPVSIAGVDTAASETRPAFTPNSRYLGFIRVGADGHSRIIVWDSETQTILNAPGFDLGQLSPLVSETGSLSLYQQFILNSTQISSTGTVSFNLASASGVGILVQRVIGHHHLFGRQVPTLKLVGRVPFGKFVKGKRHVKWNFEVNGKRLRPGTYQITVRAVTPKIQIRDLGTPHIIRLR
jgi:hypothetical protein